MIKNINFMLAGAAVTALALHAMPVKAADTTVVKTTTMTTTQQVVPATGTRVINFLDFDINNDRLLSTFEVGEMLFNLFDSDGNEVIDNVEYEYRNVMTVVPMAKETTITYDLDNDGLADEIVRTYETVLEETHLTRFGDNEAGLSPKDFVGKSFMEMDINRSKGIEMNEWRGAYIASIAQKNEKHVEMND